MYLPHLLMANPHKARLAWKQIIFTSCVITLHFMSVSPHLQAGLEEPWTFLPVSEDNRLLGGTHKDDEQHPNADSGLTWSR